MVVYHATHLSRLKNILQNGLTINSDDNLVAEDSWADQFYGCRPIYVSLAPNQWSGLQLLIKIPGKDLYPNLPSLIDTGAYWNNDELFWEEGMEPSHLKQYLEDGSLSINKLLQDDKIGFAAILTTRTAAILHDIDPNDIQLLG